MRLMYRRLTARCSGLPRERGAVSGAVVSGTAAAERER